MHKGSSCQELGAKNQGLHYFKPFLALLCLKQYTVRASNLKYLILAMSVPLGSSLFQHTGLLAKQGSDKHNSAPQITANKGKLCHFLFLSWIDSLSTQVRCLWIVPSTMQSHRPLK